MSSILTVPNDNRRLDSRKSHRRRSVQRKETTTEEVRPALWQIPTGALHIVRFIAAKHLTEKLIDPAISSQSCGSFSSLTCTTTRTKQHVDFEALLSLVQQYPEVCQETYRFIGKDGKQRQLLLLHLICTLKPTLQVVTTIYQAYPQAISIAEASRGSIPLHYAAAYEAPTAVMEFLIQTFPAGLQARLKENISPLDLACYHYTNESTCQNIQLLLSRYPNAATEHCKELHWFPLHSAVSSGAPLDTVIRPLLQSCPHAASSLGQGMDSPLHVACKKENYQDVVFFLIQHTAPEILALEDRYGTTPTVLAIMHQPTCLVKELVDRTPARVNHSGWTLLHFAAVSHQASTVSFLSTRFPDMLTALTLGNRLTPLHLASRTGGNLEIIQLLVMLNPHVLKMADASGKTPLELASKRSDKDEAKQAIVNFLRESELNHFG